MAALWISQACLSVSHKRVSIVMKESPFVLTTLQPVWIAVAFGIVWAAMCFRGTVTKDTLEESTETDEESTVASGESVKPSFRVWHSAVMGLLFTTYNFLGYSGARGHLVSGPLIILLQQTVIPLTMLFSVCFLGRRYFPAHFLSCAAIVAGILVSFVGKDGATRTAQQKGLKNRNMVEEGDYLPRLLAVSALNPERSGPHSPWAQSACSWHKLFQGQCRLCSWSSLCSDRTFHSGSCGR